MQQAYGSIPQIPMPTQTQGPALRGNIANLGALYGLGGGINAFQQTQAPLGLKMNLPGYEGLLGTASQTAQSLMEGKIPQDVLNQLAQTAAERGVRMGSPLSPNANAALLAATNNTSLGLQQQGLQNFQTLAGMTPQVAPMDLSRMLVTPAEQQDAAAAQALYSASPNPAAAAQAGLAAAQAGLGAGRAMGPSAPAFTGTGGGFTGAGAPAPDTRGISYGGVVYPVGTHPGSSAAYLGAGGAPGGAGAGPSPTYDPFNPYQNLTSTGAGMTGTAGVPLTGDPFTDTAYSAGGATGDPFLDDLYSMYGSMYGGGGGAAPGGAGTFYAGPTGGAPAEAPTGGYTYMGPSGGEDLSWLYGDMGEPAPADFTDYTDYGGF